MYFKSIVGVIIVYDVSSKASFNEIDYIVKCVQRSAPMNCVCILCANKSDLVGTKVITTDEGLKKAEEHNMLFFETSVKNGINVNEMFEGMNNEILERYNSNKFDQVTNKRIVLNRQDKNDTQKSSCSI